ncbi:MAG: hypothetical protein LBM09_00210 [Candidatus Nomurabacteria bacterium]|jgi:H2-forming N5,N10-methylenetetrahydromethanopterin dehydrogenase-like enzyme|nr:hypothetical protein [Candidatus Nomurabacteria bacterium]
MTKTMEQTLKEILGDEPEKIRAVKNLILDEECLTQAKREGRELKLGRVNSGKTLGERLREIVGDDEELIGALREVVERQVEMTLKNSRLSS